MIRLVKVHLSPYVLSLIKRVNNTIRGRVCPRRSRFGPFLLFLKFVARIRGGHISLQSSRFPLFLV